MGTSMGEIEASKAHSEQVHGAALAKLNDEWSTVYHDLERMRNEHRRLESWHSSCLQEVQQHQEGSQVAQRVLAEITEAGKRLEESAQEEEQKMLQCHAEEVFDLQQS